MNVNRFDKLISIIKAYNGFAQNKSSLSLRISKQASHNKDYTNLYKVSTKADIKTVLADLQAGLTTVGTEFNINTYDLMGVPGRVAATTVSVSATEANGKDTISGCINVVGNSDFNRKQSRSDIKFLVDGYYRLLDIMSVISSVGQEEYPTFKLEFNIYDTHTLEDEVNSIVTPFRLMTAGDKYSISDINTHMPKPSIMAMAFAPIDRSLGGAAGYHGMIGALVNRMMLVAYDSTSEKIDIDAVSKMYIYNKFRAQNLGLVAEIFSNAPTPGLSRMDDVASGLTASVNHESAAVIGAILAQCIHNGIVSRNIDEMDLFRNVLKQMTSVV